MTRIVVDVAVFDKDDLMNAIPGYGEMTWRVVGKLKAGRSFAGVSPFRGE